MDYVKKNLILTNILAIGKPIFRHKNQKRETNHTQCIFLSFISYLVLEFNIY